MSDYISRKAAVDALKNAYSSCPEQRERLAVEACIVAINSLTAADVEPVRHGRWECVYDDSTGETDITCSHCKNTRTVNGCFVSTNGKSCYFEDDYCPSCGAKMDLEEKDNEQ